MKSEAESEQSGDARDLFVDWLSHVVKRWRPQYDPPRAAQHCDGKQPQKEAVEHHRDELPVLNHLNGFEFVQQRGSEQRTDSGEGARRDSLVTYTMSSRCSTIFILSVQKEADPFQ